MINQFENELSEAYPDGLTWQKRISTFHPETAAEAADVFRRVTRYKQKVFISGFGNLIDPVGDRFKSTLIIKTDRLNGIEEINADDFHITVGSGYPLKEINKVIKKQNLWFPFGDNNYPGSFGGALASGLRATKENNQHPLSRHLLSVTAVLADGTIISPGSKTYKSISGVDLSGIFYNSWGMLGIIISLSWKILPLAEKRSYPRLSLMSSNRDSVLRQKGDDSALAEVCRTIRKESDPHQLLFDPGSGMV